MRDDALKRCVSRLRHAGAPALAYLLDGQPGNPKINALAREEWWRLWRDWDCENARPATGEAILLGAAAGLLPELHITFSTGEPVQERVREAEREMAKALERAIAKSAGKE